jgi:hypothetical protein
MTLDEPADLEARAQAVAQACASLLVAHFEEAAERALDAACESEPRWGLSLRARALGAALVAVEEAASADREPIDWTARRHFDDLCSRWAAHELEKLALAAERAAEHEAEAAQQAQDELRRCVALLAKEGLGALSMALADWSLAAETRQGWMARELARVVQEGHERLSGVAGRLMAWPAASVQGGRLQTGAVARALPELARSSPRACLGACERVAELAKRGEVAPEAAADLGRRALHAWGQAALGTLLSTSAPKPGAEQNIEFFAALNALAAQAPAVFWDAAFWDAKADGEESAWTAHGGDKIEAAAKKSGGGSVWVDRREPASRWGAMLCAAFALGGWDGEADSGWALWLEGRRAESAREGNPLRERSFAIDGEQWAWAWRRKPARAMAQMAGAMAKGFAEPRLDLWPSRAGGPAGWSLGEWAECALAASQSPQATRAQIDRLGAAFGDVARGAVFRQERDREGCVRALRWMDASLAGEAAASAVGGPKEERGGRFKLAQEMIEALGAAQDPRRPIEPGNELSRALGECVRERVARAKGSLAKALADPECATLLAELERQELRWEAQEGQTAKAAPQPDPSRPALRL